uniref:ribosomal protein L33 n=1 Tax=Colpomenia sinuosa TaxID=87236 RepID=UPI002869EE81|nr:ribosomal protein L33 [Colpomenia sinuosa]WJZ45227.1 ribosomal protein L33 [Colpomenia sinuosa]
MAKNKGTRIIITLRCTECKNNPTDQKRSSRKVDYTTTKNRRNTPDRLEVKKYCPNCNLHTLYREIK